MAPGETDTLHERLVAYVHTLAHGSRRGVWGEHSYARARIGAARGAGGGRARVLLAPRPPRAAPDPLDVDGEPSPPPSPPAAEPAPPDDDDDTDAEDAEWEERVAALAPSPAHARLADAAADALRRMRLARLARPGRSERREHAAACARRLRRALAPAWAAGGAPAWLHATLAAHLPRAERRLYEEALGELRRAVPRLAERMAGPGCAASPGPRAPPPVGPEAAPWLVWVSSGCAALDARWERRLAALVHTRVVRGADGGGETAAPGAWCAAAAGAVRAALTDALAEAGSRGVVLGALGAGCAAALVVARGAGGAGRAEGGVRGLVLAAPALHTAEGARAGAEDALAAVRLPLLVVAGAGARGAAHAVAGAGSARRLLEVRGADEWLRLPPRLRLRLRLPQDALDAALVEECVRWAVETAEQDEPGSPPAPPAPAPRRPLPALVREIDLTDEEYAHLPPATPVTPAPASTLNSRGADIEGAVVSRVSGGTPLALVPPRRAPSASGGPAAGGPGSKGPALAAADIMQLPIVFADDEPAAPAGAPPTPEGESGAALEPGALTVTSGKPTKRGASAVAGAGDEGAGGGGVGGAEGSVKFTRVILAKRGGAGGARRVLLRRGVRLVPRRDPH